MDALLGILERSDGVVPEFFSVGDPEAEAKAGEGEKEDKKKEGKALFAFGVVVSIEGAGKEGGVFGFGGGAEVRLIALEEEVDGNGAR